MVQRVVGTLLLMFGLRWLRKAVLRSAGALALHDEAKAFAEETNALRRLRASGGGALDSVAFATSFKIVMLEGIEVVFIVVADRRRRHPACSRLQVGAAIALLVVIALGLALHRPLATLPENKLKFGVGVLLSAFGLFWVGEGMGLSWPGGDWAIPGLAALVCAVGLLLVGGVRPTQSGQAYGKARSPSGVQQAGPEWSVRLSLQAWQLFVDDGWLATGVLAWVALAVAVRASAAS